MPGGLLFAAAISRFASALDGLAQDLFADPAFDQIVKRDIADGIHENRTDKLEMFTTAKFHRPDELAAEVRAAGFSVLSIVGLEGPGWLFADFTRDGEIRAGVTTCYESHERWSLNRLSKR